MVWRRLWPVVWIWEGAILDAQIATSKYPIRERERAKAFWAFMPCLLTCINQWPRSVPLTNNPPKPKHCGLWLFLGPTTTQNLVKFDAEICGGVLVENASDDFPQQKKLENLLPNFAGSLPPISPKTSPTSLWKSLVPTILPTSKDRKHEHATCPWPFSKNFHHITTPTPKGSYSHAYWWTQQFRIVDKSSDVKSHIGSEVSTKSPANLLKWRGGRHRN